MTTSRKELCVFMLGIAGVVALVASAIWFYRCDLYAWMVRNGIGGEHARDAYIAAMASSGPRGIKQAAIHISINDRMWAASVAGLKAHPDRDEVLSCLHCIVRNDGSRERRIGAALALLDISDCENDAICAMMELREPGGTEVRTGRLMLARYFVGSADVLLAAGCKDRVAMTDEECEEFVRSHFRGLAAQ